MRSTAALPSALIQVEPDGCGLAEHGYTRPSHATSASKLGSMTSSLRPLEDRLEVLAPPNRDVAVDRLESGAVGERRPLALRGGPHVRVVAARCNRLARRVEQPAFAQHGLSLRAALAADRPDPHRARRLVTDRRADATDAEGA